jgi:hypothetical protein
MATFRYYLLDGNNGILTADFLDSSDLNSAIVETHHRTLNPTFGAIARAFEIWQDTQLLHQETLQAHRRVDAA